MSTNLDLSSDLLGFAGPVGRYGANFCKAYEVLHPLRQRSQIDVRLGTPVPYRPLLRNLPRGSRVGVMVGGVVGEKSNTWFTGKEPRAVMLGVHGLWQDPADRLNKVPVAERRRAIGHAVVKSSGQFQGVFMRQGRTWEGRVSVVRGDPEAREPNNDDSSSWIPDLGLEVGAMGRVNGEDYAAVGAATTDGNLYFSYNQAVPVGKKTTVGGEVMAADLLPEGTSQLPAIGSGLPSDHRGTQVRPGLSWSVGGATHLGDDAKASLALTATRAGPTTAKALYERSMSENATLFAGLELSATGAANTRAGYRVRFPLTLSDFRGVVTSEGRIMATYERRLLSDVRVSAHVDATVAPRAGQPMDTNVGVSVEMGDLVTRALKPELTPVLVRDGPESLMF